MYGICIFLLDNHLFIVVCHFASVCNEIVSISLWRKTDCIRKNSRMKLKRKKRHRSCDNSIEFTWNNIDCFVEIRSLFEHFFLPRQSYYCVLSLDTRTYTHTLTKCLLIKCACWFYFFVFMFIWSKSSHRHRAGQTMKEEIIFSTRKSTKSALNDHLGHNDPLFSTR